jgi:hypothetical protein
MLEWAERLPPQTRRILIHINNTNPILDEDSPSARVARPRHRGRQRRHGDSARAERLTRAEFERQRGERGRAYHIHHPFNVMLNTGKATPVQIRAVANRTTTRSIFR